MKFLTSVKVRIFLTCWIVYSLFFATNVVREHYPAFALIDRGNWVCDRYEGMHWDLFRHTDGHVYTGNNVMGSLIAVPPLLLFDPVLDRLEAYSKKKLVEHPEQVDTTYDTKFELRRKMFRMVKLAGLDLRFGASTAITSALLMAPLCAYLVVLMFGVLLQRGVERGRAVWLAFLFAFATPVFYRSAHLNHNVFLMAVLFGAFLLLWRREGERELSLSRRAWAGFLCGMAISLDYAGVIPAGVLALYFVVTRARESSLATAVRESVAPVLAAVPPILFLLGTQWAMYGNAFTPGQMVMPNQNEFVDTGKRGIGLPSFEILLKNLISPSWGLIPFAPLLLFAFWPARRYRSDELIFPRLERRWSIVFIVTFMLFCAMNTYSLLQFNTGFRYLLPLVPLLFLAASDHLARLNKRTLAIITVLVCAHAVVLSMTREVSDTENDLRREAIKLGIAQWEVPGYWHAMLTQTPVPASWGRLFTEGPQLPWLTVLRQTSPNGAWLASPLIPLGLLALGGVAGALIWRIGRRATAIDINGS